MPPEERCPVTLCCSPENDLYRVLCENKVEVQRYVTPAEAVECASSGTGVLILADRYPERTTVLSQALFDCAAQKKLRLYVEYPSMLPDLAVGQPREHKKGPYGINLDREVITSDAFGPALPSMSIVMVKGCRYLPMEAANPHIVTARVAGYNRAEFGLPPDDVWPILFEHPRGDILAATTMLSHFVTGRYAPTDAWAPVWRVILSWLLPNTKPPQLKWTPTVRPSYGREAPLPADAELDALRRGVSWYGRSKLFLEPSGKKGFHEGYNSKDFFMDGSHGISTAVRSDCTGEVAMSLGLGAAVLGDEKYRQVARNLNDLLFFESQASRGSRLDPKSPSYGLIGWDDGNVGVYYGDDAARHLLGGIAAAAALKSDRWDDRTAMDILANFRTTGPAGFRKARIEEPELQQHGWRHFWEDADASWGGMRHCPHYQAYLWAVCLWLYDKTGFQPLFDRTEAGIRHLMELDPDHWDHEANRHEPERCRMLLPLAWLIRVADTPEHRLWLDKIKEYVLDAQRPCGAIPQRIIRPTTANEQYGTGECALIQDNGDPCTDLLYATNFAFIGLHEAAAATGDAKLKQAEDRLADFLVRIQIRSEMRTELDGAWYRGFDYDKWDYWGSDGDIGWGVWSIETGWTQGWITATFALRRMKTSLWDFTKDSRIAVPFEKRRGQMLPQAGPNGSACHATRKAISYQSQATATQEAPEPPITQSAELMPGTRPIDLPSPLDVTMLQGAHRFIERKIADSAKERGRFWKRDCASATAYEQSIRTNREHLKYILGLVQERLPAAMERFGDDGNPALVAETKAYRVFQVRWPVWNDVNGVAAVFGEGLLLEPRRKPVGGVIALPDADQTPEQPVGLAAGITPESQFARYLAEQGFVVVVPVLINRDHRFSGAAVHKTSSLSHRDYVYLQAFHMGRHLNGYEVAKVLAAVDWFKTQFGLEIRVGAAGYGEGGLTAFYAAAVDPRIAATLVSGYFQARERCWQEPLDRTQWGVLAEFGDAELATLIAPRGLVVEHSALAPCKVARPQGELTTPVFAAVRGEFERISTLLPDSFQRRELVYGAGGTPVSFGSRRALRAFTALLAATGSERSGASPLRDSRTQFDPQQRQRRQLIEIEKHIHGLIDISETTRDNFFPYKIQPKLASPLSTGGIYDPEHSTLSAEEFAAGSKWYREYFRAEIVGRLEDPYLPLNPRTRKRVEKAAWSGYDVVLDVYPDFFAWGVICLPKGIKPGEKRPVLVFSSGLENIPDAGVERKLPGNPNLPDYLAERGCILFVPHGLFRGGEGFCMLDRKAKLVKATLFSFIQSQHEQILKWLSGLPYVDPARIGFYGISYGGTTATYVPPALEQYCLSICAANFNDYVRKITDTRSYETYVLAMNASWEVPFFNMGNTFSQAELAYLMIPRPFMVERGMHDPVARDADVAHEYAKVHWLYTQLGIRDRTQIEFFNGGHVIRGNDSLKFLDRFLLNK